MALVPPNQGGCEKMYYNGQIYSSKVEGISSEEFEKVTSQASETAVETGDCRN